MLKYLLRIILDPSGRILVYPILWLLYPIRSVKFAGPAAATALDAAL